MSNPQAPDALLFTAPGCPHCPGVKAALEKLQQEGVVASLRVLSVIDEQAQATALGVRSVPWLKLGEFILTGAQTPQQLRQWAERAASGGMSGYLEHLLANGELKEAEALLERQPQHLDALLPLLAASDTKIQVRLGIGALIEGYEGSDALHALLPQLLALSTDKDHRIRSDACHYLGLSHNPQALPALEARLNDENTEVREIAAESIALIQENTANSD